MLSFHVSMKTHNINYIEKKILFHDKIYTEVYNNTNNNDFIKTKNLMIKDYLPDNNKEVYNIFKKLLETNNSINKKKNRITSGLLHFLFENCAEIMQRADLLGYYEMCMSSKGKRKFDVFRRHDIYHKNLANNNINLLNLKSAQIRWTRLANKIGLLEFLFKNWNHVRQSYIEYKRKKLLITKRKRGRKKRQPVEGCISFNSVMNCKYKIE